MEAERRRNRGADAELNGNRGLIGGDDGVGTAAWPLGAEAIETGRRHVLGCRDNDVGRQFARTTMIRTALTLLTVAFAASCGGGCERLVLAMPHMFGSADDTARFFADCWRLSSGMTLEAARASMSRYREHSCNPDGTDPQRLFCATVSGTAESQEELAERIVFTPPTSEADWCMVYVRKGTVYRIAVSPD